MNRRTTRRLVSIMVLVFFALQALPAFAQSGDAAPPDDFISQLDALRSNRPTYSEDFRRSNTDWETDTESDSSAISIENRAYRIDVNDTTLFVWGMSPTAADNFYVESYAEMVGGPTNNEFGIVFRHQDSDNFYTFMASSDGYYALRTLVDNEWTDLIGWTATDAIDLSEGASNLLGLYADGSSLVLLINDVVVDQFDDGTFASGGIGLSAGSYDEGGVQIAFDDFAMWDLATYGPLVLPDVAPNDTPTAEPTGEPTPEPTSEPAFDAAAILDRVDTVHEEDATLSEDFRRDSGAWALGSEDASEIEIARRALSIHIIDPNWLGWSNLTDVQAADLLMEADIRLDSGPTATEMGIMFRYVDADNFYLFAITGDGSYSLWKLVDNEWQELLPWTDSTAIDTTRGAVNRLAVLAEGDTISLVINDEAVAEVQDDAFTAGEVGLAVGTFDEGDATAIVDNVDLWVLSEEPAASVTPEADATPEATATPQAVEPPPADDALARMDTIKLDDPTAVYDFRRDDGSWSVDAEDDVTHTYARRALQLGVDKSSWVTWSLNQELSVTDFLAEVDAAHLAGPTGGEYGMVFRYNDESNLYLYVISAEGYYSLLKLQDGQWEVLVDWTESDALNIGENALNRLGLLAEGTQITLFANSIPLTTVEDDTFASGSIGLAAGTFDEPGLSVSFDNFSYWEIAPGN